MDACFRQFNGHTQVNATDLRSMRYPAPASLAKIGERVGARHPPQQALDEIVEDVLALPPMANPAQKVKEALEVLKALGMPAPQQNERSALTLLALVGLKPKVAWADASSPLMGITPLMDFFRDHYGKEYKPNTRETVRRQTVHQFLDAGFILANPDQPGRAVNSPKAVYQIDATALELLRAYGTSSWSRKLASYLKKKGTLAHQYAQASRHGAPPGDLCLGGKSASSRPAARTSWSSRSSRSSARASLRGHTSSTSATRERSSPCSTRRR